MEIFQKEVHIKVSLKHKNRLDKNGLIYIKIDLLGEHFRCHILRTSTIGVSNFVFIYLWFRKSKISDFDPSISIKKNILKFNISKEDIVTV